MKRNTRKRWIGMLSLGLIAVAAIVVGLLAPWQSYSMGAVFAGTNDTSFTATGYSDVIRFQADGVVTLQVRVFDLSGKVVWDSSVVSGDSIDWNRNNDFGERLAYGAYIYSAQGWNAQGRLDLQKNGKLALMPGDKVQLQAAPVVSPNKEATLPLLDLGSQLQPMAQTINEDLILNNGNIYYQRNSMDMYKQGISGIGGYQFMDLVGGNKFYIVKSTGAATATFDFNTGALSLGSTQLKGLLYVAGSSYYDGNSFYRHNGVNTYKTGVSGSGGYQFMDLVGDNEFYIVNSTGRVTAAFDFNTGKLGVGTTTFTAKLTVEDSSGQDLIAAYNSSSRVPGSAVFVVKNDGEVRADGAYYSGTGGFHTGYADVAERINTSEWVDAECVVEIDPEHPGFFRKSSTPYSTKVAGIISTSPGVILGNSFDEATDDWEDNRPVLAVTGRVPCKVSTENGPIEIGDLLVASSALGIAMKGNPERAIGTVIGKAMEPLAEGTGTIVVQVMLR